MDLGVREGPSVGSTVAPLMSLSFRDSDVRDLRLRPWGPRGLDGSRGFGPPDDLGYPQANGLGACWQITFSFIRLLKGQAQISSAVKEGQRRRELGCVVAATQLWRRSFVRRAWRKLLSVLPLSVYLLLGLSTAALASTGAFAVKSSPNEGTSNNQLFGVASASASDAWSVGYFQADTCVCDQRTLSEHWNGRRWKIVSSPDPATESGGYDVLKGVAAVSASDVWAVGYSGNASEAQDSSLIEHWNGAAWTVVPSPDPDQTQDLYAVAAVSSSDVWAVGAFFNYTPYGYGALIELWIGTSWTSVPNPATTGLDGVAALASNDVWAVGGAQILHWNGIAWSVVSSPQGFYDLQSVAAVSASDVWAVGYQEVPSGEGYYYYPLVEHWDGSSWSVVGSATGFGQGYLFGVTAASATSVWAVGDIGGLSFAEKWDGTQWIHVPTPNVGTSNNTFQAVAENSGNVWAVGEWYQPASPYQAQTFTERCAACS
jgi:hypothetical protein